MNYSDQFLEWWCEILFRAEFHLFFSEIKVISEVYKKKIFNLSSRIFQLYFFAIQDKISNLSEEDQYLDKNKCIAWFEIGNIGCSKICNYPILWNVCHFLFDMKKTYPIRPNILYFQIWNRCRYLERQTGHQ